MKKISLSMQVKLDLHFQQLNYADSHCTIENYLVIVDVQNFPVKFQFSELFFVLLMKFILLLLLEHLSRRLFTLPLAAPILSSV